ncbi:E3 ubiquitin-protein ligase RFWD2 isoform B [Alligator mississippiensis]|uniref:E3 ubiquitin-protein ligase RFWD2 isoform B n=1 Tax=Alligator mississippiensis TaxID=8496 RepID=A0A151MIE9_ALLMI|nr:E3 ubiquitin-protein ligase RFWD2 isoform B [Alligator mississippiensis]
MWPRLPTETQLAITLLKLAMPTSLHYVGHLFGMDKATTREAALEFWGTLQDMPGHTMLQFHNPLEDKSNDFVCPICFDMIEEAYMTKCGHSFCYKCIHQSLEDNNRCPKCNYVVDNIDHLYPNFLVNELILKQKQRYEEKRFKLDHSNGHRWQIFQDLLGTDQDNLDLANVNLMLELLVQKKKQLEAESHAAQLQILMEFLKVARRNKREQLEQIQKELSVLEEDIKRVEEMSGLYSPVSEDSTVPQCETPSPSHSSIIDSTEYSQPPGFSGSSQTKKQPWYNSTLASRRKRLTAHFEDLEQCYFSTRMTRVTDDSRTTSQLDEFQECLSKFTRYNSVRPLATLSYASDLYNGSSIVSSIEFDRDCDYFAIAGVTKKIKVYEYGTVIQDAVDIHYPENEMTCNSKISCISWSSYHKNLLASSDYEGTVILWDGFTGQRSKVYQEHEKRCWSVDFNLMDPKLLASGSDDAKVKLWSTNLDNSVASIEAKANVCCVKFSPSSRYHLAFGCADHCVHYYDLRNTKQPIMVFKGHRKAVSYAKFVSGEEIVSASTDSQLKLWNVGKPHCLRSFKGHINEKNFVGLASNGDYIACGSENNSLYLYYKGLSKTLLTFKFDTVKSVLDKDRKEDDTNEFVSAVCWRALPDGESNVLIAANSQGTIKVLELAPREECRWTAHLGELCYYSAVWTMQLALYPEAKHNGSSKNNYTNRKRDAVETSGKFEYWTLGPRRSGTLSLVLPQLHVAMGKSSDSTASWSSPVTLPNRDITTGETEKTCYQRTGDLTSKERDQVFCPH